MARKSSARSKIPGALRRTKAFVLANVVLVGRARRLVIGCRVASAVLVSRV
jgi:hypothetical protein